MLRSYVLHHSYVFTTTVCLLILHPTSLTFLPFTPLPSSFDYLLITLSSVIHLSVQYPMIKGLSHTPPLLLGTLFLSRSSFLIMSLVSDPELKLTLSVLPIISVNLFVISLCFSVLYQLCCWMSGCFLDVLSMFCNCNNVSVICNHMIVTGYVLLGENCR